MGGGPLPTRLALLWKYNYMNFVELLNVLTLRAVADAACPSVVDTLQLPHLARCQATVNNRAFIQHRLLQVWLVLRQLTAYN